MKPAWPPGAIVRDNRVLHEACEAPNRQSTEYDANADHEPDLVIVSERGREVCRSMDFNFDGHVDSWVYREPNGAVRRRESDFDRDGRIDEISVLKAGRLFEKHRATTQSGKLDTWHFYREGKLTLTQRDTNQDRMIDQWWEYPRPDTQCALVHIDLNRDGRPDPGSSVEVCEEPAKNRLETAHEQPTPSSSQPSDSKARAPGAS